MALREKFAKFFEEIETENQNLIKHNESSGFQNQLIKLLEKVGFVEIANKNNVEFLKEISKFEKNFDIGSWTEIKKQTKHKNNLEVIKNPFKNLQLHFIYQPFGDNAFPNFLVFVDEYIYALEIIFSKKGLHSFWNSNLLKSNSLYVYGIKTETKEEVIFFKGSDFLNDSTRLIINEFLENIQIDESKLNKKLLEKLNDMGLLNKSNITQYNFSGLPLNIQKAFHSNEIFKILSEKIDNFEEEKKSKWKIELQKFIRGE